MENCSAFKRLHFESEIFALRYICDNKQTDSPLHIQIRTFRVALNKAFPWGNFIAHEHVEGFVGFDGFFDGDFQDRAVSRIHGGVPEGFGVHFAEALVASDIGFFAVVGGFVFVDELVALFFGVDVLYLLTRFDVVERGLGDVEVPAGDQGLHVTEEEGEQERADVRAVNVGIAHDYDAAVAELGQVEVFADTYAGGCDDVFDLFVAEHFVEAGTLDVEYFTA